MTGVRGGRPSPETAPGGAGRPTLRGRLRDERGQSLALVAVGLIVFLALAAVAIDLGMLFTARRQAQRAADAAALAGAGWMVTQPGDTAGARRTAIAYGDSNTILGEHADVLGSDVSFPQMNKVRVWVRRVASRGDAVPTIFARVLGIQHVDVVVEAAALIVPATKAKCVLPILLPDHWYDADNNSVFDSAGGDYYIPWEDPVTGAVNDPHTGYDNSWYGKPITIRAFQNPGTANSSWYYPFRQPGMQGGADYRDGISGVFCTGPDAPVYGVGDSVLTEPGAMIGPTLQGFQDLINSDPDATWDPNANDGNGCVVNLTKDPSGGCVSSSRIRPLPLFDPVPPVDPGIQPIEITNFAGLFIEGVVGNTIQGIFVGFQGVNAAPPGSDQGAADPLGKAVKLVE